MTLHDITARLRHDLPTWPGEPGLERTLTSDVTAGDPATVSVLRLGSHTGTHIDAPVHFLPGAGGIDAIPLDALVGPAVVVDLTGVERRITGEDLTAADVPHDVRRVLARTRNSGWSRADRAFRDDFVAYDESAARWAVDRSVVLLGIDYLSIEPFGAGREGHPVHHLLLRAGVVILEGLELDAVEAGPYELMALPTLVPGCDGAPARAVLRRV